MALLGIDYGAKTVGVARSDETERLAFPVGSLANNTRLFLELGKIAAQYGVTGVVIGESKDLQWQDNPIMKQIRAFSDRVRTDLQLAVYFEEEYFTSTAARRSTDEENVDAAAAALILQSYLDKKQNKR